MFFKRFKLVLGEGDQHFRVEKLLLPVGHNDSFKPVYEFNYKPPIPGEKDGTTTVKKSDGSTVIYHFSKNLLTTLIQYFDKDKILKKEKAYSWNDKNFLQSLEIKEERERSSSQNPMSMIPLASYFGKFFWKFNREGNHETYAIKREFSQDGRNLLVKKRPKKEKFLFFLTFPIQIFHFQAYKRPRKNLLREFFTYDDYNNLIEKIFDDGDNDDKENLSHVSQRIITRYILRQSAPFYICQNGLKKLI